MYSVKTANNTVICTSFKGKLLAMSLIISINRLKIGLLDLPYLTVEHFNINY